MWKASVQRHGEPNRVKSARRGRVQRGSEAWGALATLGEELLGGRWGLVGCGLHSRDPGC